jgi:hypothetical protein
MSKIGGRVARVEPEQHRRVLGDPPDAQQGNGGEPGRPHRAAGMSYTRGPQRLNGERRNEDRRRLDRELDRLLDLKPTDVEGSHLRATIDVTARDKLLVFLTRRDVEDQQRERDLPQSDERVPLGMGGQSLRRPLLRCRDRPPRRPERTRRPPRRSASHRARAHRAGIRWMGVSNYLGC